MGAKEPQAIEPQARVPDDAVWVDLSDELLASERHERWCGLVDTFEPPAPKRGEVHQEGQMMAKWLHDCVHDRALPPRTRTRAVHNDELLGFFSTELVSYMVSNRPRTVLAVSRRLGIDSPERGLLLSSIVRSNLAGEGFGRFLLEEAVGLALELESERITSILVEPANEKLRCMWQDTYHFAPLEGSELLHLPVKVWEELRPPDA
jgi:hypothetical protein